MSKYTKLDRSYWRYIIKIRGRAYCRQLFHHKINTAAGCRREALIDIYLEVFRARA